MSRDRNSEHVAAHFERRKASGELERRFFVREEHLEALRLYQRRHGLSSQHSALQALLNSLRDEQKVASADRRRRREVNSNERDRA